MMLRAWLLLAALAAPLFLPVLAPLPAKAATRCDEARGIWVTADGCHLTRPARTISA